MNKIKLEAAYKQIERSINRMEKLEKVRQEQIKKMPKGVLHAHKNGRKYSLYRNSEGESKSIKRRDYISKELATKHFLSMDLQSIRYCLELARTVKRSLQKLKEAANPWEVVCGDTGRNISRKAIQHNRIVQLFPEVAGAMTPDEVRWVEAPYQRSSYKSEECRFETPGGVRVRSKSEYIIACFLEKKGIPYRYEPEVWTPHKVYYADFEIYVAPGETVYWEHLGMAGVDEYDNHNIEKLRDYSTVGVTTRKNLIITFEEDISSEEKLAEIVEHVYVL